MLVVSLYFAALAHAFVATHQVRPNSSFESAALANSCSTMVNLDSASHCNPALFATTDSKGIEASVLGKSDGESIENGRDLILKPISEDLIRRLFQKRNFNSFTLSTDLAFRAGLFELSYSPYYLMADVFIYNPAFPEISLNLVNREVLRLTTGGILQQDEEKTLSWGISPYFYKHSYMNTNFSLLELSTTKPADLLKFQSLSGASADGGFFYENKSMPISRFAAQIKNITSKVTLNQSNALSFYQQTNRFMFEPYSSAAIGKNFVTPVGGFDLNLQANFDGYFQAFQPNFTTLSATYSLRLFSLLLAYSQRHENFGLKFTSKYFDVGLFYTREVDIGSYDNNREQSVYTGIGVKL